MTEKIATLYGKPLEDYTKEELIDAIQKLDRYYRGRLDQKQSQVDFLWDIQGRTRKQTRKNRKRNRQ